MFDGVMFVSWAIELDRDTVRSILDKVSSMNAWKVSVALTSCMADMGIELFENVVTLPPMPPLSRAERGIELLPNASAVNLPFIKMSTPFIVTGPLSIFKEPFISNEAWGLFVRTPILLVSPSMHRRLVLPKKYAWEG